MSPSIRPCEISHACTRDLAPSRSWPGSAEAGASDSSKLQAARLSLVLLISRTTCDSGMENALTHRGSAPTVR
jgi:hypothetical protein